MFGNWERESATEVLVQARIAYENGGRGQLWGVEKIIPRWAHMVNLHQMVCVTGEKSVEANTISWADKLRVTWNDVRSNRGPLKYFQGVLRPARLDKGGNVLYKYNPMPRRKQKTLWRI